MIAAAPTAPAAAPTAPVAAPTAPIAPTATLASTRTAIPRLLSQQGQQT